MFSSIAALAMRLGMIAPLGRASGENSDMDAVSDFGIGRTITFELS